MGWGCGCGFGLLCGECLLVGRGRGAGEIRVLEDGDEEFDEERGCEWGDAGAGDGALLVEGGVAEGLIWGNTVSKLYIYIYHSI